MQLKCLEMGDIEEPRCRLCCIEDLRCNDVDAEAVGPQEYQSLGYAVAGIERLYNQQQAMLSLLDELVQVQKEIIQFARDRR